MLLIHGFPTASFDWDPVWDILRAEHSLIALDMLGFSFSDKPRAPYHLQTQADIKCALLDHLNIASFDIVAHDYGDSVAQELLARHNENSALPGLGKVLFLNDCQPDDEPQEHAKVAEQHIRARYTAQRSADGRFLDADCI